jgi:hypothetical protein
MTKDQLETWMHNMIRACNRSTYDSDINVLKLIQHIENLYEKGRADEREQAEKQEPVAYKYTDKTNPLVFYFTERKDVTPNPDVIEAALYTAPPRKEWVGLTDEEMENLVGFMRGNTMIDFARAIEAKLKEHNT